MSLTFTHIDTACCLLEVDGYRILTDPVLDDPGKWYHHGFGAISRKTSVPGEFSADAIDAILLSHPQHMDNFDHGGRALANQVSTLLSTPAIRKTHPHGIGMSPWQSQSLDLGDGKVMTVTATPAWHRPRWMPEFFSGKVVGFVLEFSHLKEVIYLTGDTIYFNGIREVARRFPSITHLIAHVGAVRFTYLSGLGKYTMDARGFLNTIQTIKPEVAIPIHTHGWTHFKEGPEDIRQQLDQSQEARASVIFPETGEPITLEAQ